MNWHYAEDGQQRGPVAQEEFDRLAAAGRITPETLVWREGMDQWRPWGEVRAAGADGAGAVCGVCGRGFAADAVIQYEGRNVCAECKPAFFRRLQEGGAGIELAVPGVTVTEEELLARDYAVDIGARLARGWEVFKAAPGPIIGASVLVYACFMAASFVPFLGGLLSMVVSGPLFGGYWLFLVRRVRGQDADLNVAFSGFTRQFGQLVLTGVVVGILSSLCLLPGFVLLFGGAFAASILAGGGESAEVQLAQGAMMTVGGITVFLGFLAYFYLVVAWMFALPLVSDKGYAFWPAMNLSRRVVNRHFWQILLLSIAASLIGMAGVLALCVGLLVTVPLMMLLWAGQYDRIFRDLAPRG